MKKTQLLKRLTLLFFITFSMQFTAVAQLCGVYTIDAASPTAGTNYQTFSEAVTDLNSNGVSCAVTFNVASGTYNDNVSLTAISGSSATNTISFIGAGASSTILTYDGATTQGTWQMSGTSHIIIKHLTIENTKSSSEAWGVHMMNATEYITIDSCSILLPIASTSDVGCIVVSASLTALNTQGNSANHVSVTNSYLEGGYQGLRLSGTNSANGDIEDFYIGSNVFLFQEVAAIQILDVKNFVLEYNDIDSITSSASGSNGIMLNRVNDYTINANFIKKDGGTGLDLTAGNNGYTTTQNSIISNNMILNQDGVCFNPVNYDNTSIYNNTMVSHQGAAILTNSHTAVDIRNNIFVSEASYAFRSQVSFTSADILDNNLYYTPDANKYRIGSTEYGDLVAWQTGMTGYNTNSIESSITPAFISVTDLHMDYELNAYDNGVDVGLVTDFDGEVRPQGLGFDIGADEFTLPSCPAPTQPAATNLTSSSLDLEWIEIGSASTWNIEWGPAGFTLGSGTPVSLTTNNPYSFTNLSPVTQYDFYVQSDCGGGDISSWTGPYTVTTACGVVVAPFYEGFDGGVLPLC